MTKYLPLAFLVLWTVSAQAHRIDSLSVMGDFRSDGTYEVKVSVEPGRLPVDGTDPFPPLPPEGEAPEDPAERQAIFNMAKPFFDEALKFYFDDEPIGGEVSLDFQVVAEKDAVAEGVSFRDGKNHLFVVATYSGKLPEDKEGFRFVVDKELSMAVVFIGMVNGDPKGRAQALFAAEESRPYPLAWAREAEPVEPVTPIEPDKPEPGTEGNEPGNVTPEEGDVTKKAPTEEEYNEPDPFWERAKKTVKVGYEHILPKGLDHILFVAGLFLLSQSLGALLWQVTAFTLAHTITLGLAYMGVVSISGEIVEPLIALSIAVVAIENIVSRRLRPHRVGIVFGLGLLHGLGFAGAFAELPETGQGLVERLVFLNIGVELGQLAVIGILLLHFGLARYVYRKTKGGDEGFADSYRSIWAIPASVYIAIVALVATFDRIFPFQIREPFSWLQIL